MFEYNEPTTVGDFIEVLMCFPDDMTVVLLDGYSRFIHHLEYEDDIFPCVNLIVDEANDDESLHTVKELIVELRKFPTTLSVMASGDDLIDSSISWIVDEVYDEYDVLLPDTLCLITTMHMLF